MSKYPDNWKELRRVVIRRDGGKCRECGRAEFLQVHHVMPISRGGSHHPSNLITFCEKCHAHEHPDMQVSIAKRYIRFVAWKLRVFLAKVGMPTNPHDIYYGLGYLGIKEFLPGQREAVEAALSGRDTLVVLPTSGGKSLCYQLPALLRPGTSLIISPLIALMRDQVQDLLDKDVPATFFSSQLTKAEKKSRTELVDQGLFKLIYAAPERFRFNPHFVESMKALPISYFIVDEAHTIDQWGFGFRPDFLQLRAYCEKMGRPPILAVTATADPRVRQEIISSLGMRSPAVVTLQCNRPMLSINAKACKTPQKKADMLVSILSAVKGRGIVYCATVKGANEVGEMLRTRGIVNKVYHGKLHAFARGDIQDGFKKEQGNDRGVLVATKAFGMGINIPDIRFVIHYDIPASASDFFQGIGRAGRDGLPAVGVVLYTLGDEKAQNGLIDLTFPAREEVERQWTRLREKLGTDQEGDLTIDVDVSEAALRILHKYGHLESQYDPKTDLVHVRIVHDCEASKLKVAWQEIETRRDQEKAEVERLVTWVKSDACRRKSLLRMFDEKYPASIWAEIKAWLVRQLKLLGWKSLSWFDSPCCDVCEGGHMAVHRSLLRPKAERGALRT